MSKNKYMTKYQLEHLKKRVAAEIDPIIDEAKLMRKSVVAELTASAEGKLCLLYTSPSPRDGLLSRMPSSA